MPSTLIEIHCNAIKPPDDYSQIGGEQTVAHQVFLSGAEPRFFRDKVEIPDF